MTTRASIVMMSHLSDIQTGIPQGIELHNRCNFVKWLIQRHKDTTQHIDADAEWEEFTTTRFYMKPIVIPDATNIDEA